MTHPNSTQTREDIIRADHSPPSIAELHARIIKLKSAMEVSELDYYVVSSPDNIFYLTNFANYVHERPFVLVIEKNGAVKFIVPKLEVPHVTMRAIGDIELLSYFEFPAPPGAQWIDRFREIVPADSIIGIESICPHFVASAHKGQIKSIDLVDDLRMVKSRYELSRIQYSSDLASSAHQNFLEATHVGRTMLEASATVTGEIMTRILSDEPALNMFANKVTFVFQPPQYSHDPHNFTDLNMSIENGGPHVCILNGVFNGYGTEIERTFFMGHIPEEAKRPFDVMLRARRNVLEKARPGVLMSEVDRSTNEIFKNAGYKDNLLHRAGHGIGVTGHEAPFFAEGHDMMIEPNMVFTVEPGIYLPGIGGFRHSDTLRITETGCVMMTQGTDTLEDLILPV